MTKARFVAPAHHELLEAVRFYEARDGGLGIRLAAADEAATLRALTFPLAGTAMQQDVRRVLVRGCPFAVVYRPEDDGIIVFAVAHLSRRPDYWRHGRLSPLDDDLTH